ncbi:MAG: phospho-N-acetylmuramoyl-pentapeptide-transferase [Lachnospiraceae bacterium]
MTYTVVIAIMLSFGISVVLGPVVIPFLRKLKFGQTVREDGPETHLKKNGTPTMGGVMILTAIVITSLVFMRDYPQIIPVLCLTLGFGLVGFLDDYIKVVLKRSMGLRAWQKMALQILITGAFAFYVNNYLAVDLAMKIPFIEGKYIDFGWFNIPLLFIVVIGTDTGANFTDGLDGLATSVTTMIATFFAVIAIGQNSGIAPITGAVIGALLGFLVYNTNPAKVFMGDTGALALGGFVAASAYVLQMPLFLLIVGLIYVVEVLSVIIQVTYFKLTHGKRFFKMAPIHHHFEKCGWEETRIVTVFTIITALLCLVALLGAW